MSQTFLTPLFLGLLSIWFAIQPNTALTADSTAPLTPNQQVPSPRGGSQDIPLIRIIDLLAAPHTFHQRLIMLRGTIRQLELHLDESTLFIDYVFWLVDGRHRVLVFGRHDRTMGDIQMVTGRQVEVRGLFWEERFVGENRLENNLEAQQVRFYPPVNPDQA